MSTRRDPLAAQPQPPDRLNYATGVLLDAADFQAEQLYQRGRLARALAYLHGFGTVAGLRIGWDKPLAPGDDPNFPDGRTEQLTVAPGLALDRLGRLIEVPTPACIRLDRWFLTQDPERLAQAVATNLSFDDDDVTEGLEPGNPAVTLPAAVIADLFVRFVECARGFTPAFAAGPFNARDAVQPSRLRDGYELTLLLRPAPVPPPPVNPWQAIDPNAALPAKLAALRTLTYAAWHEDTADWDLDGPRPLGEHSPGQDPTAVFLARVVLPAAAGTPPTRTPGAKVYRRSSLRRFVYPSGLLAHLLSV